MIGLWDEYKSSTFCVPFYILQVTTCYVFFWLSLLNKQSYKKKKWQVTQIMVQSNCIPMGVIQHTAEPWFFFFFWFGVWLICWGFKCVNFYKPYFCISYGYNIIVKFQMYIIMNSSTNLSTSRTSMNLIYLIPQNIFTTILVY